MDTTEPAPAIPTPAIRDRLLAAIAGQFADPHGPGGRLAGWIMGTRRSNVARSHWAVEQLDVEPHHHVLEIGFGPGVAVADLATRVTVGRVHGVDRSALMVDVASRRNRRAVRAGLVTLVRGGADALPPLPRPLDRVLSVNCDQFWPDPESVLTSLRGLLREDGRIAIVRQPRHAGADRGATHEARDEIAQRLERVGFVVEATPVLDLDPPVAAVLARPA